MMMSRRRVYGLELGDVALEPALSVGLRRYGQGEGLAAGCRVEELLDLEGRGAA